MSNENTTKTTSVAVSEAREKQQQEQLEGEEEDGFDELLSDIGFGRWQANPTLVVVLVALVLPVHLVGMSLINAPMDFGCFHSPDQTFPLAASITNLTHAAASLDINETLSDLENNRSDLDYNRVRQVVFAIYKVTNNTYYTQTCRNTSALQEETTKVVMAGFKDDEDAEDEEKEDALPPGRYATGLTSCPYVEYDTSVFTSTVFSEFHLLCEQAHYTPLYQMVYNFGGMFGSILGGQIGDRCGRLTVLRLAAFMTCLSALTMLLAPTYHLVLLARFFLGTSTLGSLVPSWNMLLESTPARNRSLVGMLIGMPYSVFVIVFGVMALYINDWQTLFLVNACPSLLLIPLSFMTYESPRWLLQQGRGAEAEAIMREAVRLNKAQLAVPLHDVISTILKTNGSTKKIEEEEEATKKVVGGEERVVNVTGGRGGRWRARLAGHCARQAEDIKAMWIYFTTPAMLIILVTTPAIWFLHSFVYLGVIVNANNFTSTIPSLYVALTGAMDWLAILVTTPLTHYLGRRVLVGGGLFFSGVLLLLNLAVPEDIVWLKWIVVMTGFLMSAGSFQVNYVYAPELFPTGARSRGFAFVTTVGSLGFMCSPLITTALTDDTTWIADLVFGCSGIAASMLIPFLPETNRAPMPETLEDVNKRWKNHRIMSGFFGVEVRQRKSKAASSVPSPAATTAAEGIGSNSNGGVKNEGFENGLESAL